MRRRREFQGFSLVEIATALAIVAGLAVVLLGISDSMLRKADRTRMAANMRAVGNGILGWTADHAGRLPGPLWPGQVLEYDRTRPGRLVVELAAYLEIEERDTPYVVEKFFTRSLRRAARNIPGHQLRVWVMNMKMNGPTGTVNPWGSLAAHPPGTPLVLAAVHSLARQPAFWEADRTHPDVAAAPWAAFTVPKPAHGEPRLAWYLDGAVENSAKH